MTIAAFVRAAAPALGGFSWAWSLALTGGGGSSGGGSGGHQFLPFAAAALVALAADLIYWRLRLQEKEVNGGGSAVPIAENRQTTERPCS